MVMLMQSYSELERQLDEIISRRKDQVILQKLAGQLEKLKTMQTILKKLFDVVIVFNNNSISTDNTFNNELTKVKTEVGKIIG